MKYGCYCTLVCIFVFASHNLPAKPVLRVEIDGKLLRANHKISLLSGYHEIIFHFPSDIKYQSKYSFKISKLEQNWIETTYPFARYTNLHGGEFVFFLKYVNINNEPVNLSRTFEIKENFWEKWWFYLFLVIVSIAGVSLLIYFWFLYDLRQRMRTYAIRQKIAADLHDEVGANLSSISFLVESLKKSLNGQIEKFDPILDRISGNSLETVSLINDTIWALNPDYDNFNKLLERIKSFASGILSAKDISFEIDNRISESDIELSIEQRQNLYFIMKEGINNIAKHSMASKAKLTIHCTDNVLFISILDNGIGMEVSGWKEGNGLKNYALRSKGNNIMVEVSSQIGKGSLVEITAQI